MLLLDQSKASFNKAQNEYYFFFHACIHIVHNAHEINPTDSHFKHLGTLQF